MAAEDCNRWAFSMYISFVWLKSWVSLRIKNRSYKENRFEAKTLEDPAYFSFIWKRGDLKKSLCEEIQIDTQGLPGFSLQIDFLYTNDT